ncbi:hypothetical protein [Halarcobacter sp.]|uniref:hypothetical protein n=1 Tax=Halarcobacter sp. TaxID=2321133 RepID=UPI0029F488B0|nr:hypothetical protein [Halarcobacter sp.]
MIIDIDEELLKEIKKIVKDSNLSIYEQLEQIKPLTTDNTLQQARKIKTQRVKQSIQETIKSLLDEDMKPTKYQIHKRTGIAYVTINKYYDVIIDEVLNGND